MEQCYGFLVRRPVSGTCSSGSSRRLRDEDSLDQVEERSRCDIIDGNGGYIRVGSETDGEEVRSSFSWQEAQFGQ